MAEANHRNSLEAWIADWRTQLARLAPGLDASALETQLRTEIAALARAGLAEDEAFLIALNRIGRRDAALAPLTREHAGRLWPQLAAAPSAAAERSGTVRRDALVAVGFAALAALAVKAPALFGLSTTHDVGFYLRNASLFVLPCLTAYFISKRRLAPRTIGWLAAAFVASAVFANLAGFGRAHEFEPLTALHLPIAVWLAVGIAYAGGEWTRSSRRMDFIRFSGELFIYYVLIALGGGVLTAFLVLTFKSIGVQIEWFIHSWLLPCGAAGAVIIASWLVEAKQGVLESMAPMLTRLFTPLFAAMLVAFLGTLAWSGRGIAIQRELLIGFDLLLVVVLGLLLYSISSRDPAAPPGIFDWLQVVLLVSALLADAAALWAIGARIHEFGFSPNRVAALGENIILLANLGWSALLYVRFMLRRGSFASLERWQTGYVPVYSGWAAVVVVVFPPLFRWIG